jgi:hypothetical protein
MKGRCYGKTKDLESERCQPRPGNGARNARLDCLHMYGRRVLPKAHIGPNQKIVGVTVDETILPEQKLRILCESTTRTNLPPQLLGETSARRPKSYPERSGCAGCPLE